MNIFKRKKEDLKKIKSSFQNSIFKVREAFNESLNSIGNEIRKERNPQKIDELIKKIKKAENIFENDFNGILHDFDKKIKELPKKYRKAALNLIENNKGAVMVLAFVILALVISAILLLVLN